MIFKFKCLLRFFKVFINFANHRYYLIISHLFVVLREFSYINSWFMAYMQTDLIWEFLYFNSIHNFETTKYKLPIHLVNNCIFVKLIDNFCKINRFKMHEKISQPRNSCKISSLPLKWQIFLKNNFQIMPIIASLTEFLILYLRFLKTEISFYWIRKKNHQIK